MTEDDGSPKFPNQRSTRRSRRIDRQDRMSERDFTTTNVITKRTGPSADGAEDKPGLFAVVPIALGRWTARQWSAAVAGTVVVGAVIGLSTVLIPNGWFGREIDSVAWNYPVWLIVSVLSGMLFATYVRPERSPAGGAPPHPEVPDRAPSNLDGPDLAVSEQAGSDPAGTGPRVGHPQPGRSEVTVADQEDGRESRLGMVGVVLGWFAVGCPVCNKIALIALGYTGALRWFAPFQPILAITAIAFSTAALLLRLRGQVWCPVPRVRTT